MRSPKFGDVREDGYKFIRSYRKKNGMVCEQWLSPRAVFRQRLCITKQSAKLRAKQEGVPFDITTDHLEEIFPKDGLCPVLKIPLVYGNEDGRDNSPSLDRREPALGYTIGNVGFVSNRINQLKGALTLEQLERLVLHVKGKLE